MRGTMSTRSCLRAVTFEEIAWWDCVDRNHRP
jgi:hypothetical protein